MLLWPGDFYRYFENDCTANATDPRDQFYAVLGLAPEMDRSALIPDYTKSLKEICGQFIKHIIDTEKKLDILAFDHSSCEENLPTWAPNFTSLSRSASIGWRPYWQNFWASGKAGANPPQEIGRASCRERVLMPV